MADRADEMSMAVFTGRPLAYVDKDDGSPVTETDRLVEETLRGMVADVRSGDGFVGEEAGTSPASRGRRWIVDPIDGTKSFISGRSEWGTLIALEENGELTVGVATAPALGGRWWAGAGHGAFSQAAEDRTPHRLEVSGQSSLIVATWGSIPVVDPDESELVQLVERLAGAVGRQVP